MKKSIALLFILLTGSNFIYSQILWDDFEQNRIGYYDFVHGGMTERYENPDINSSVNSSPLCAQYVRNPGEMWDVLVIVANGAIDDVGDYVSGDKIMSVDVFSPMPGLPVQITLEDSSLAGPTNYPTGRHSVYLGQTTKTNEWETINFIFDNQPDPAMSSSNLTSVILLFNGGSFTNDTYYFDNLYGPEFNNQCDGLTNDPLHDFADWDCNWNLSMCPSQTQCNDFDYMSGWLNQSYNPENSGINTSKYSGDYTRNPDPNGEDVLIAYFQEQDLDVGLYPFFNMKVYGPPTPLYISFQNNGTEIIGFEKNIWQNNTWQQLNLDLSSISASSMSINRVVLFFDQGMVNWNTYFLDDIGLSSAPVSINEKTYDFKLILYPKPAKDKISLSLKIFNSSSVKVEIINLQGKKIQTIVNGKNLEASIYSYEIDNLRSGLYFLKTTINGVENVEKFEVIR
ncbi:T9SS type A sorting domain-containing protein [Flavobacteriales bacterium]|nr:T9SS type A sorting domain-containing protein [Flavobacteriales bacterium]|tara:strand:+ start:850 stop:2211 length:1362 start_codon:yes stop_codon:yes gene_type:complete